MRFSLLFTAMLAVAAPGLANAASPAKQEQDGTVHVSAFDLPLSGFLSAASQAVLKRQKKELEALRKTCRADFENAQAVVAYRQCLEKHYYRGVLARHHARYKVTIEPRTIAGVATEIFTPVDGVSAANRHRVLINLHGGSFITGGRWGGQVESIPIAAVGRIRVVSVDYRMAPEHRFPAASEDVAAVYRALLRDYKPESIGIYGCSAGGILTAQSVAWFQKERLPRPAAIGMLCGGAARAGINDSLQFYAAMNPGGSTSSGVASYLKQEDLANPLAVPALDSQTMARFPPSLLITSTRDFLLSPIVVTHAQLVRLGVEADLHVWEGLDHAFLFEPDLPESHEAYDVIVRFFDRYLADTSGQ